MTKKLAPCLWKKPRKPWDARTLKAVQRWLRAAADTYSVEREQYESKADPATRKYAAEIYGAAKAAVALRNMARAIDLKLRDIL